MSPAPRQPLRRVSKRAVSSWLLLSPLALGLVLTLAIVAITATAASAQTFFDPTSAIQGQASGWVSQAAGWAQRIYISLLIFEIIALAITALLFRENLGEFVAGIGLKVFVGSIYFWFINNAGTDPGSWTQLVIKTFRFIGLQFAGMPDSTPEGPSPFLWLGTEAITAATAYIGAAIALQFDLQGLAAAAGLFDPAAGMAVLDLGHFFEMAIQGMAVMLIMGMGAIYLQLILITVESYIVMGAGIVLIGFAGSRFTMPFSQGYFSYMINVGVKYLVVYLILGIEQPLMNAILGNAVAALAGSLIPGVGLIVPLIFAAFGLTNVLIAAALIWMIPGLVGSLLSGQSSASGSAVLGQAMSAMSGAAQAIGQLNKAHLNEKKAKEYGAEYKAENDDKAQKKKEHDLAIAYGTEGSTGIGSTGAASQIGLGSGSELAPSSGSGQPVQSSTGTAGSNGSSGSASEPGDNMPQLEYHKKDLQTDAQLNYAFAMSALAQAAPRDIGQPSAVQVRLSNPDKL